MKQQELEVDLALANRERNIAQVLKNKQPE